MRSTIIGVVMGVVFIAALFGISQLYPHSSQVGFAEAAQSIEPGFVGVKMIGPWQFACAKDQSQAPASKAAIPFTLNPNPHGGAAAVTAAQQSALGRCRTTLIYTRKGDPKAVILVVSFRYAQNGQKLAMIVRFPALAQKGDQLLLRVGQGGALRLPVSQCSQGGCLAAGLLSPDGQNLILGAKKGVLVFPAKKDSKPLGMLIPFTGLKDALAAMRRAES